LKPSVLSGRSLPVHAPGKVPNSSQRFFGMVTSNGRLYHPGSLGRKTLTTSGGTGVDPPDQHVFK
jgi:hypothetical protein